MKYSDSRKLFLFAQISTLILILIYSCVVKAAVINVTSGSVNSNTNGDCSIVEAMISANSDTSIDNCTAGSGSDQIHLPSAIYTLNQSSDNTFGYNGLPCITSTIEINGNGSTITRSSNASFRIICITSSGSLFLDNTTLSNGLADGPSLTHNRGGAIMSLGHVDINNVTFSNNDASVQAGAIFFNGGSGTISNSFFQNNTADTGGAIRTDANAQITISNSNFSNNSANRGGAMFINDASANIYSTVIDNNQSDAIGGGIYFSNANALLSKSVVSNNITVENGGGIRIDNGSDITISETYIHSNVSSNYGGGGIYVILSQLDLFDSAVTGNISGRGAGLYVDVSHANVTNTTFSDNKADVYGGAIYLDADESLAFGNASATIRNATIVFNEANTGAGGLWMNPITVANLSNTLIANNTFRNCGGVGVITVEEGNWLEDQYCSGQARGNAILIGPLKANGGLTPTHSLLENSPLIDSGFISKCSDHDQRGKSRPFGNGCDIGAYEYTSAGKTILAPIYYLLDDD